MFNRVAFVTGASRGIGRAIALALGRDGFVVVAAATTIEDNHEFAEEISAFFPKRSATRRSGEVHYDLFPTQPE